MYIDLSLFSWAVPYLPAVLPFVVTFVAGILRQDGLPSKVNEGITIALVLIAAAVVALYNHALTPDAPLDLVVILGYTTAIMRLPFMQGLQQYLQSNWVNVILSDAAKLAQASARATSTVSPQPWQRYPAAPVQPPVTYTQTDYNSMQQAQAQAFYAQQAARAAAFSPMDATQQPTVAGLPAMPPTAQQPGNQGG